MFYLKDKVSFLEGGPIDTTWNEDQVNTDADQATIDTKATTRVRKKLIWLNDYTEYLGLQMR